jgi:hypothetical protein
MIQETLSRQHKPALTSDHWHIVHARWAGEASGTPRFEREIVSEHDDRASALVAARKFAASISDAMLQLPHDRRDEIVIRRPEYKSLKTAKRRMRRRRA